MFLMIIFTFFVYRKVPETKNRTFEEIASQFQPGGDIDVEEIVADDDVFGTLPPVSELINAQVVNVGNDIRASVAADLTKDPKNSSADDESWVIHL